MARIVVHTETIKTYTIIVVKCPLDDGSHEYVATVNGSVVCEDCDNLEFTIQRAHDDVAYILNTAKSCSKKPFKPYTTKTGTHHPFSPSLHGSKSFTFSAMVKNGIATHGLKWAVEFYLLKHGLTGAEFRVFAGI